MDIWCYSVGGGQARDVGKTCLSAGEKYGRKVFPDVTAKFAAEKENVQEGETSANLEVQMDG
jgi:hypothetical protein